MLLLTWLTSSLNLRSTMLKSLWSGLRWAFCQWSRASASAALAGRLKAAFRAWVGDCECGHFISCIHASVFGFMNICCGFFFGCFFFPADRNITLVPHVTDSSMIFVLSTLALGLTRISSTPTKKFRSDITV